MLDKVMGTLSSGWLLRRSASWNLQCSQDVDLAHVP